MLSPAQALFALASLIPCIIAAPTPFIDNNLVEGTVTVATVLGIKAGAVIPTGAETQGKEEALASPPHDEGNLYDNMDSQVVYPTSSIVDPSRNGDEEAKRSQNLRKRDGEDEPFGETATTFGFITYDPDGIEESDGIVVNVIARAQIAEPEKVNANTDLPSSCSVDERDLNSANCNPDDFTLGEHLDHSGFY